MGSGTAPRSNSGRESLEVNAVFNDDVVPLGLVGKDRGSVAA